MELDFAAVPSGGFTVPGSPLAEGTAVSGLKSSEFGSVHSLVDSLSLPGAML